MAHSNTEVETKCGALRQELKAWERQFSKHNNGRKAGKADIRANAEIATKYKEYNHLRNVLSGQASEHTPPKKRKPGEEAPAQTPTKRRSPPAETPNRTSKVVCPFHDIQEPPCPQLLTTPAHARPFIGPTPQKDGLVLGLFDLLPDETPSKRGRTVFKDIEPNALATPSKNYGSDDELTTSGRAFRSRTPRSEGKWFMLDTFATPMKRKREDDGGTPSSQKTFATPMFLRRESRIPDAISEEEELPRNAPWRRKGLGRSLSTIIREMKKQEEEQRQQEEQRIDEELEMLHELEMEAAGLEPPVRKAVAAVLQVQESQAEMPLGPDHLPDSEEEDEHDPSSLGPDGQLRKVWKKKGLKRQTRRVIMRPVQRKAPAPETVPHADDSRDEREPEQAAEVIEAKPGSEGASSVLGNGDSDASDWSCTSKERKTQPKKAAIKAAAAVSNKAGATSGEGLVKKAARKISAQAHANFRKLKLRNKQPQGQGRFGRRR